MGIEYQLENFTPVSWADQAVYASTRIKCAEIIARKFLKLCNSKRTRGIAK